MEFVSFLWITLPLYILLRHLFLLCVDSSDLLGNCRDQVVMITNCTHELKTCTSAGLGDNTTHYYCLKQDTVLGNGSNSCLWLTVTSNNDTGNITVSYGNIMDNKTKTKVFCSLSLCHCDLLISTDDDKNSGKCIYCA